MAKKFLIGVLILVSAYAAILIFFGDGDESQKSTDQPTAVSKIATEKEKPNSPLVIQSPAQKITNPISNDESSPDTIDPTSIAKGDIESAINQYFTEEIKNFNLEDLKPAVKQSDLKIINETNKEVARAYLDDISTIYQKNFKNLDQRTLLTDSSLEIPINFDLVVSAYQKTIDALYKTAVPQNLAFIHREQIALLSAQKNALEIAKDYEKDPLKATLALQAGEELTQDFANLQNTLSQLIE